MMKTFETLSTPMQDIYSLLVSAIAPRPIAFVSTLSKKGVANLAPYSFFNAFGSNPAMLAFSPVRKARNGELKDTYHNLMANQECVVNIVNYSMLEQMNITAAEYTPDISEFEQSGFTQLPSLFVKPARVQESTVQMECKLHDMINLGDKPGSGNLAICQILCFHVNESLLDDKGRINPLKVDHVARSGGNFYTRATPENMFELAAPKQILGLGFGVIPKMVRESAHLTGNLIARLASVASIPEISNTHEVSQTVTSFEDCEKTLHRLLTQHKIEEAWKLILIAQHKGWISYEL